ncbi:MAG: hypothetical protein ACXW3S_14445 [Rhodoplanes sp.]
MTASSLVRQIADAGGRVWMDGESLRIAANRPLPNAIVEQLRRDKPEVVAVLRLLPVCCECAATIVEPVCAWWGGRAVHVDCGRTAWARQWRGEVLPAAAVAAKH